MSMQPLPDSASPSWVVAVTDRLPAIRNGISFAAGIAVAAGVMSASDQSTILDAVTHIGADVKDIAKYVGIIAGVTMPIWAQRSSTVVNLIKSLSRKEPAVQVVAPPKIAAVTPAVSSAEVAVVNKVSGQEMKPPTAVAAKA